MPYAGASTSLAIQVTEEAPPCESYTTQAECEAAGCYWYDNACHSTPRKEGVPLWVWAVVGGTILIGATIIIYETT